MDIRIIASGSSGNCYRVSDGETPLLLDAGIPLKAIQVGCAFQLSKIAGCLITHAHGDHIRAAKDLVRLGMDVYASPGTIAAGGLQGHRIHPSPALTEFSLGTWRILPFDVQHDAPDPLGFLLVSVTGERLLYFTDTFYLKYTFSGLTHIMAECNYDLESIRKSVAAGYIPAELVPRLLHSHMSLEHLVDMLQANDLSKVRQIYLLHLSANNSVEDRYRQTIQRLTGTEVYIC